jgi:Uncharacterized ACR, COG1993
MASAQPDCWPVQAVACSASPRPLDRSEAVEQDCVKLTSYFSDRHKAGGRMAGRAQVARSNGDEAVASIVLRGTGGSALMQQVRPWTLRGEVLELAGSGLVTLERGRLLSGEIDPVGVQDKAGEATRLTMYFSGGDRVYQVPAFEVICELLHRRGIAGAIALAGLASDDQRVPFRARTASAPVMVVAVTSGDRLGAGAARARRPAPTALVHPGNGPHLQA